MRRAAGFRLLPLGLAALLSLCATSVFAQALEPIRYTVSFPAPHTHYLEVEAAYPTGGRASIDLFMAVWTPGSYLIREYERHVEGLPKQQRNVVRALVLEGASVQETATRLKISKNAVYVTLHRAAKGLATKFGIENE